MTLSRYTVYSGIATRHGRVGAPIRSTEWGSIAGNQAKNYEDLTHKHSDGGGGAPGAPNAGHRHDSGGNLLYLPLLHQVFGDEGWQSHEDTGGHSYNHEPAVVQVYPTATAEANAVCWYFPIWIASGWSSKVFRAYVRFNSSDGNNPHLRLTLETAIGTSVSGMSNLSFEATGRGGIAVCYFTPATTGLHVLKITTSIYATASNTYHSRRFFELAVMPDISHFIGIQPRKPEVEPSNYAQVGDPDNSNAWHPIDNALHGIDAPCGALPLLLAHNDALIQELATGLPAAGQSALTVSDGHVHEDTGQSGRGIEMHMGAWCWGPHRRTGGVDLFNNALDGHGLRAPQVKNTTYKTVRSFDIRTPKNANRTAANSQLRAAFVGYVQGTKGSALTVRLTTNPNDGSGSTQYTYTASPASDTYVLLADSANRLTFANGGYTTMTVEIKDGQNSDYDVGINGMCLYFDQ